MDFTLIPHFVKSLHHDRVEFLPDAFHFPGVMLAILYPFEITGRHAARIGQDVWQHDTAPFMKHFVGPRMHRCIGGFDDDIGLDLINIALVDNSTNRSRNQ